MYSEFPTLDGPVVEVDNPADLFAQYRQTHFETDDGPFWPAYMQHGIVRRLQPLFELPAYRNELTAILLRFRDSFVVSGVGAEDVPTLLSNIESQVHQALQSHPQALATWLTILQRFQDLNAEVTNAVLQEFNTEVANRLLRFTVHFVQQGDTPPLQRMNVHLAYIESCFCVRGDVAAAIEIAKEFIEQYIDQTETRGTLQAMLTTHLEAMRKRYGDEASQ